MSLVTPDLGLLFWTLLTFLILVFLLRKFAWRPILDGLRIREDSIAEALSQAEEARKEMAQLNAQNQQLLDEARKEREQMLKEAMAVATKIKEEAKADAEKQADKMIADAKATINTEKAAALAEVKNEVAKLSLTVAEKLLRKNLADDKEQQALVEGFIKEVNVN